MEPPPACGHDVSPTIPAMTPFDVTSHELAVPALFLPRSAVRAFIFKPDVAMPPSWRMVPRYPRIRLARRSGSARTLDAADCARERMESGVPRKAVASESRAGTFPVSPSRSSSSGMYSSRKPAVAASFAASALSRTFAAVSFSTSGSTGCPASTNEMENVQYPPSRVVSLSEYPSTETDSSPRYGWMSVPGPEAFSASRSLSRRSA